MFLTVKFFLLLFFTFPAQASLYEKKLKMVLHKYKNQNVFINVEKELYIPIIKKRKKEKGLFYLSKNKFRLQTQTSPGSLIIFDGSHMWYQSNLQESTVLKSKADHPYLYLFSNLFNPDKFFKTFKIISSKKKNSLFIYQLRPLKNIGDIKEMTLFIGNHIQKLSIKWEDLDNSQSYYFRKPWFKKYLSPSLFVFKQKNFQIITKD